MLLQSSHIRIFTAVRTLCSTLTEPVKRSVPNPIKPILISDKHSTLRTNYFYFFHMSYLLKLYFYLLTTIAPLKFISNNIWYSLIILSYTQSFMLIAHLSNKLQHPICNLNIHINNYLLNILFSQYTNLLVYDGW
jgi:hypothetical protein